MATNWLIEISFEEDDTQTSANAQIQLPDGKVLRSRGQARRNPSDPQRPQIGEEIAAARALSEMTHILLDRAAGEIEEVTHKPAHIYA